MKYHEIESFHCLGNSNWTKCNPLSHIYSEKVPSFSLSYWEANSYYPRGLLWRKGISSNLKIGEDRGVWVPGAFKLKHLHPVEPLFLRKFSFFFTFILGGQFLLPLRANNGKVGFSQLEKWMRQRLSCAWEVQTRPFAAPLAHFVLEIFHLFHFHTGRPILITPEG